MSEEQVTIKCAYTKLEKTESLKENPRNPNFHPESQIRLLAKIIQYTGWRQPIIVSNLSGLIVKGHARLRAAKLLNQETVPVEYQDYDSAAQEAADMVADNEIAHVAHSDMDLVRELAREFKVELLDLDLFGIENLYVPEIPLEGLQMDRNAEWKGMPEFSQPPAGAFRTIIVHLKDEAAVEEFENLVGQSFSDKTKFIWYPKQAPEKVADKRYVAQ